MELNSKIYIAGHNGLIGSAIFLELKKRGYNNLIVRSHSELDLTNELNVDSFFERNKPEYVFLCAAYVGGIGANKTYPADFLMRNLSIEYNIIRNCHKYGCSLLFLGSTCIYPKSVQDRVSPMREEDLLTSDLDTSNEGYAIAKITGLKMVELYRKQYGDKFMSVMPTNLYGPNDKYDIDNSHVLPSIILKLQLSEYLKSCSFDKIRSLIKRDLHTDELIKYLNDKGIYDDGVVFWGTGDPMREFLFSQDCAKACINLLEKYDDLELPERNCHINIGNPNQRVSIRDLVKRISFLMDYSGRVFFTLNSELNGTLTKYVDSNRLHELLGGFNYTPFNESLMIAIKDFRSKL
jgi:GDP-L-fucose synthase